MRGRKGGLGDCCSKTVLVKLLYVVNKWMPPFLTSFPNIFLQ